MHEFLSLQCAEVCGIKKMQVDKFIFHPVSPTFLFSFSPFGNNVFRSKVFKHMITFKNLFFVHQTRCLKVFEAYSVKKLAGQVFCLKIGPLEFKFL